MAETTLPPVRGFRRLRVLLVLGVAGTGAGAAAGAAAGLAGLIVGAPPGWTVVVLVVAAALAELVFARTGRPRPWSVGRQVPAAWSRVLEPEVAAALYGLRLGIGPATVLSSWLWWAAFVLGALAGPAAGAATGASFALARAAATAAVSQGAGSDGLRMAARVGTLARLGGRAAWAAAVLAVAGSLVIAACGTGDGDDGAGGDTAGGDTAGGDTAAVTADAGASTTAQGPAVTGTAAGEAQEPEPSTSTLPGTAPLTVPPPTSGGATSTVAPPVTELLPDVTASLALELTVDDLAALVVPDGPAGFAPVPAGELGTGPLDLDAAAAAEPDAAAERALLLTRGFVQGHARAWEDDRGATAVAVLYHFTEPQGAGAYLLDGGEHALARGATPFPVDLDGAFGFSQVDETGSAPFVVHAVVLVRGPVFALVLVGSPDGSAGPEDARALARAQAATLEAAAG